MKDIPDKVLLDIYSRKLKLLQQADGGLLLGRYEELSRKVRYTADCERFRAVLKTKPKDVELRRQLAMRLAQLKDWPAALAEYAQLDSPEGKAATAEKSGNLVAAADAWWDFAENVEEEDQRLFRQHAADLYRQAVAAGKLEGIKKSLAQKRAAEANGVVHRDIKPDNILFDAEGVPRLADLGVAKRTSIEATLTLTMTDMVVGTPQYMAPEQLLDSKHVDGRADIYSLGLVLWEMLAGESPNADLSTSELMTRAIRKMRIPDIRTKRPKVSRRVRELLRRMTAPRLENRFQHPAEILEFLDEWEAHERRRWLLVGITSCLAAIGLGILAVILILKAFEEKPAPSEAEELDPNGEFSIPDSVG